MTKTLISITIFSAAAAIIALACGSAPKPTPNPATVTAYADVKNLTSTAVHSTPIPSATWTPTPTITPTPTYSVEEANEKLDQSTKITARNTFKTPEQRDKLEAGRLPQATEDTDSVVNMRHCEAGRRQLLWHALNVPGVLDAETALRCSFEIWRLRTDLKIGPTCDLSMHFESQWKMLPTPVNTHDHTHDETYEQDELVIKCKDAIEIETGIDVKSTQDMVIFISEPDELHHSHWHEHPDGTGGAHPHKHSHDDAVDEEHQHRHNHPHYEREYAK